MTQFMEHSQEEQFFASDVSDAANTSIAKLKNINFCPKIINYAISPAKNNGYIEVDGEVNLCHTTINIDIKGVKATKDFVGKSHLIIASTKAIKGVPKILDLSKIYKVDFEKSHNKAYVKINNLFIRCMQ